MPRILSLDRIRIMALLGVVFYHLSPGLVPGGYLGVNIFFALTGFLTLLNMLESRTVNASPLLSFARSCVAKGKKLYPPLLITLFLSCLFIYLLFSAYLGDVKSSVISSIFSITNYNELLSGGNYFANTGKLAPFTHLWALAMEVQVYLLFFALSSKIRAAAKSKKGLRRLFLILLGLSLISYIYSLVLLFTGADFSRIYYDTLARLYSFSLGSLSALLAFMAKNLKKQPPSKRAIIILSLILVLPFFILRPSKLMFGLGFFLYSILTALLLFFLNEMDEREIPILDGLTRSLAERSYVIFLWHYPLISILDKLFASSKVGALLYYPLFFLLVLLLSEATYRFVKALKGAKILYILSLLMAIALLLAPYEALSGSGARAEVMKQVMENEKLIKDRAEAEAGSFFAAIRELKETAEQGSGTEDRDPGKQAKQEAKDGKEGTGKSKDREAGSGKELSAEELKARLAESETYETALSFIEETNELHPDAAIGLEDFNRLHLKDFLLIGDSIASMSYHTLYAYMPRGVYDSNHSRQMDEAPAFLENYLKTKEAPELIFVQLGTNGGVDKADIDKLRALAPNSKFFLYSVVLPYKAEEDERNNAIYSYYEEHKSEKVYLVDWYKHTKTLDIFFEDNIHPGEEGAKILAQLMLRAMVEAGE